MHRSTRNRATGNPEKALMENAVAMTTRVAAAGRGMPAINQKDREVLGIANQCRNTHPPNRMINETGAIIRKKKWKD
jgi:hypothetical protein